MIKNKQKNTADLSKYNQKIDAVINNVSERIKVTRYDGKRRIWVKEKKRESVRVWECEREMEKTMSSN